VGISPGSRRRGSAAPALAPPHARLRGGVRTGSLDPAHLPTHPCRQARSGQDRQGQPRAFRLGAQARRRTGGIINRPQPSGAAAAERKMTLELEFDTSPLNKPATLLSIAPGTHTAVLQPDQPDMPGTYA